MSEWYEEAFGELYSEIYSHRDDQEAERAIQLLGRSVPLRGRRVLDVCCGEGRHLRALRRAGATAYGVDLSEELLKRHTLSESRGGGLSVRGDMRSLPFCSSCFDACINMFTSLGYFDERSDELRALSEMQRVLVADGHLLLDHVNASWLRQNLAAHTKRTAGSLLVEERRAISPDGKSVFKTTTVWRATAPSELLGEFTEKVTLFERGELREMLRSVGLDTVQVFGDYEGAMFEERSSPRLVVLARKHT